MDRATRVVIPRTRWKRSSKGPRARRTVTATVVKAAAARSRPGTTRSRRLSRPVRRRETRGSEGAGRARREPWPRRGALPAGEQAPRGGRPRRREARTRAIERAGGVRISGRGREASLHEEGGWISDGASEIDESDREHDERESAEEERDRFAPPGEPCEERVHQEVGERSIRPVPGDALVRGPGDRKTAPRREGSKEHDRNERRTRNRTRPYASTATTASASTKSAPGYHVVVPKPASLAAQKPKTAIASAPTANGAATALGGEWRSRLTRVCRARRSIRIRPRPDRRTEAAERRQTRRARAGRRGRCSTPRPAPPTRWAARRLLARGRSRSMRRHG